MSSAPIGIAFTRAQRFELVSAELCRLLGRAEHELLGQPVESIYVDREHYLKTLQEMDLAFRDGRPYAGEWQMGRADGSAFCAQLRGRPVDLQQGGNGTIWTVSDVSEQVASRELLEWSATHDALTGLSNRSVLEQRLATIFAARAHSQPSAVVAIDLDHFKPINDSAGHAAGDEMLRAVAQAISSCVRASDLVVRLGGDEFALLLEGCPSATALRIANDVRAAIFNVALPWKGRVLRVGASLGVADLRSETESVQAWLAQADAACYEVKRAGRGAVRAAALQPA
jgi:diguanylate cyclase